MVDKASKEPWISKTKNDITPKFILSRKTKYHYQHQMSLQVLLNHNLIDQSENTEMRLNKTKSWPLHEGFFGYLSISNSSDQIILNRIFVHLDILHNFVVSLQDLRKLIIYLQKIHNTKKILTFFIYYEFGNLQIDHINLLPLKNTIIFPDYPYSVLSTEHYLHHNSTYPQLANIFFWLKCLDIKKDHCIVLFVKTEKHDKSLPGEPKHPRNKQSHYSVRV